MPPNPYATLPSSTPKTAGTTPNNTPKISASSPQHAASQTTTTTLGPNPLKPYQILNGAQLKYIAIISMLIDHTNNALITPMLNGKGTLLYISNAFSISRKNSLPNIHVFPYRRLLQNTKSQEIPRRPFDLRTYLRSPI